VSAGEIRNGKWTTVLSVSEHELTFLIGTPKIIGKLNVQQWSLLGLETPSSSGFNETVALQDAVDRAFSGSFYLGI
jgi:hypothetical protein